MCADLMENEKAEAKRLVNTNLLIVLNVSSRPITEVKQRQGWIVPTCICGYRGFQMRLAFSPNPSWVRFMELAVESQGNGG